MKSLVCICAAVLSCVVAGTGGFTAANTRPTVRLSAVQADDTLAWGKDQKSPRPRPDGGEEDEEDLHLAAR